MDLRKFALFPLAILLSGCLAQVENPIISPDQRIDLGDQIILTDQYPYPELESTAIRRVFDISRLDSSHEYRILEYSRENGQETDTVRKTYGHFANVDGKFLVLERMPAPSTCQNPGDNRRICEIIILELTQDRKILHHTIACSQTLIFAFSKIGVEAECTGDNPSVKFKNIEVVSTPQLMCAFKLATENSTSSEVVGYWKDPIKLEVKNPCARFL